MKFKNYYKILGLSQTATEKEIRQRFRELARKYHPDVNKSAPPERFHDINEAYQNLSDASKRARYDRELRDRTMLNTSSQQAYSARPTRPAPKPGERYSSHRKPPTPEPTHGPVHNTTTSSADAMAGAALFAGIIVCAVLSFTALQVLNVLAGNTTPPVHTLAPSELRQRTQVAAASATFNAIPTAAARQAFSLVDMNLNIHAEENADDPLFAILQGDIPEQSQYCLINLNSSERPCNNHVRLTSITGNIRNQAVSLRVTLDKQNQPDGGYRRAIFRFRFDDNPSGISLSIGDTRFADGDGRDLTSNEPTFDAELVIDNGDLFIYGYDTVCTDQQLLYGEYDFVERGSRLIIEISDQEIRWINETNGKRLISRCLFQLGGQSYEEEPVEWDFYVGLNRTAPQQRCFRRTRHYPSGDYPHQRMTFKIALWCGVWVGCSDPTHVAGNSSTKTVIRPDTPSPTAYECCPISA